MNRIMNRTKASAFWALCLLVSFSSGSAFAQQPARSAKPQAASLAGGDSPIEVSADQLEYEADKKLMTGRGHVLVKQGADKLTGDFMTVRTDTQEAHAIGNVVFEREGKIWRGDDMTYNFKTRTGNFGSFEAYVEPFYVRAKDSQKVSDEEFILQKATITTCEGERPEFSVRAREARVIQGKDGRTIKARGVVFFLGVVPIFYVPVWSRNLDSDTSNIDLVPGYSSRMGGYLLTAYNYRLNRSLRAATHLDYRGYRGFGVGQDFLWGDPNLSFRGSLQGYYADDEHPFRRRSKSQQEDLKDLVTNDRYRLRLFDLHKLSDRDYLNTELNYLSDPLVLDDFFQEEYRSGVQPENRIALVHRGDNFQASVTLNKRLNDFYDNVDRLPEAALDVNRIRLGESPFFYESHNTAAWLQRVFPEDSSRTNYDAFRIDSQHTIYYPGKYFGFLVVTPRAGYRATYYSSTIQERTITNVISTVDTNGIVSVTNDVQTLEDELGSDLRNVYELGFETSFKSFKVLHNGWLSQDDQGLRHVVEPYARHTYIPEPNVLPENLLQFDSVDEVDKQHDVRFGVRNKLQTKRRQQVHDLVDFNVWTTYLIERDEDANEFGDLNNKTELRLADWVSIDFDVAYDMYESLLKTFNSQIALISRDESRLGIEYRYKEGSRDQVAAETTLFPNSKWSFNAYGRYAIDRAQMDEHSYFIQHKTKCLGMGLGYRQIFREDEKDDIQVWFRLWLLALPKSSISIGG